jgi:Na+/melibiose symporter-like transporter
MGLNFLVVHNLGLGIGFTALPLLAISVVSIIFAPIWAKTAKKIGVRKSYILSLILNSIMYLSIFFVNDIVGLTLVYAFGGIGISANYGIITGLATAEAIDNATVHSGKREEASFHGILRIFSAYSYTFQALIFAVVGGITGYNAAFGTNNTEFAKLGLNIQMSLIPMVINLIGIISLVLMYKISKTDAEANKEKLIEMGL